MAVSKTQSGSKKASAKSPKWKSQVKKRWDKARKDSEKLVVTLSKRIDKAISSKKVRSLRNKAHDFALIARTRVQGLSQYVSHKKFLALAILTGVGALALVALRDDQTVKASTIQPAVAVIEAPAPAALSDSRPLEIEKLSDTDLATKKSRLAVSKGKRAKALKKAAHSPEKQSRIKTRALKKKKIKAQSKAPKKGESHSRRSFKGHGSI